MKVAHRQTRLLVLAAFIPLLALGLTQLAVSLRQWEIEAENNTLLRVMALSARIDSQINADVGALQVLSTSQFIANAEWPQAQARAQAVVAARPQWKNVLLTEAASGLTVWQTATQISDVTPTPDFVISFLRSKQEIRIGDIADMPRACACITLSQRIVVNGRTYALTVLRGVMDLQDLLIASLPQDQVSALLDRRGLFIARSLDFENRLATPGTRYVQEAIARGGSGVYSGTTWEGLTNRTAYMASTTTGWSTHIAVPSKNIALIGAGSVSLEVLAFLLALLVAGLLSIYAIRDIRARRAQEQANLQSQKLEAMGRLSGTVAHDFNNLLAVMVACVRLLEKLDDATKKKAIIGECLAASERGGELIKQLLAFSREKPLEVSCVNLGATVRLIREILARTLGSNVDLEIELDDDACYARTNAAQLEMALLNLAVNARDAMASGGKFIVTSSRSRERGFVDLVVRDTGSGMTEKVAAHALEPYFTTKESGKGTGLGLAQVHVLAQQSGGTLLLDTAPGKGTKFTLRLPACDPE